MANINLYPTSKKQRFSWYKFSQGFKIANLVITILFFVTSLVVVALITLNQNAINQAKADEESYRNKLKALAETESQYSFLKDRAMKADEVLKTRKVVESLEEINSVFQKVNNVNLSEVSLDGKNLSFTASVPDFNSLKLFLSELKLLKSYQTGSIGSLSFNPEKGYSLDVTFKQ